MEFQKNRNFYFLVAIIFIVNFLFKLIYIGYSCFWYDEIISAKDTLLDFGHIKHEAEWDKNPPFYHYVLWIWSGIFGITETALRSMSAFFSALTAVLIFIFVYKISSKFKALVSVLIFTLHPYLYYFAQEARCYSLLIFLLTVNLIVVHSLISNNKKSTAFLLGVLNFLIFYTHYLAGLILVFQFFLLAFIFRKRIIYLILIYLTPIVLILIRFTKKQYLVLFFSNKMSQEKQNVPLSDINTLKESIPHLFVSWFVFIGLTILLLFFLFTTMKKNKLQIDNFLLLKLYIVFSPILCVLSLFFIGKLTNVYNERYLIFIIPYFIISLHILLDNKNVFYLFVIMMLGFEIFNIKFKQSRGMDYRFCAILSKEIQKKDDINIVVQTQDVISLFIYYYDNEMFKLNISGDKEKLSKRNIYYIENYKDFLELQLDNKPVLFFQTFQKKDDDFDIHNHLNNNHAYCASVKQISGVKCTYYKK